MLWTCSHMGIWKKDFEMATFCIGAGEYEEKECIKVLDNRIIVIDSEKWFIPKYITFQYGNIASSDSRLLKSVYIYLKEHKLIRHLNRVSTQCVRSDNTPKDKDKDKDKDKRSIYIYLKNKNFKEMFENYLSTRKKKATPYAQELILKDLHKHDITTAIAMLEQSIKHGWIGIFELKNNNKSDRRVIA